jgi:hypothetical protein
VPPDPESAVPPPTQAFEVLDARLRKALDDAIPRSYVASVLASEFVREQRRTDPELFYRALDELAVYTIRALINDIDRVTRMRTLRTGRFEGFRAAADAHAAGDTGAMHRYLDERLTVDSAGTRKLLGDCRRDDLRFVTARSQSLVRTHQLRAALTEAIRREIGDGTVRERYTDEQLASLDASLRADAT